MPRPFLKLIADCFVTTGATIGEAARCIDRAAVGICLVVDGRHHLITTITDGDIRRGMLGGLTLEQPLAGLLERRQSASAHPLPVTCPVDATDAELLDIMRRQQVQHVPLLDEVGRVVDMALLPSLVSVPDSGVKAVVMAGGFGTRMRPFTDTVPKPMLAMGDKPLLERTIEKLRDAGITEVDVTTHYLRDRIVEHFGSGQDFGVRLNYVQEDKPLGTAGALGQMGRPSGTTLVMNGDILTTIDFRAMVEFHRANGAIFTVAVRHYEFNVPYGVVESDGIRVTGLREKPQYRFFVNAGIYLAEPAVWDYIEPDRRQDMTDLIDRLLVAGRPVISFPIREYWMDIGQPDDYRRAQDDIKAGILSQESSI